MPNQEETINEEMQLLIFSIANEKFACKINQVIEITKMMEITKMPKAPVYIKGVINLRGKVIAVIDLARQLALPSSEQDEETRIIVVDLDDNIVGMLVESASEVMKISEENIEATPAVIESKIDTRYIEGIGRVGEHLFVLLDLNKVFSSEEMESIEEETESMDKATESVDKATEP